MDINTMAQSPEGYLWLGARDGLWRFDGVTFERIPGPEGSVTANAGVQSLRVTSPGTLWVGFGQGGGIAVYRGGRLVDMKLPNPPPAITNIVEGPDRTIWAEWGGISDRLWQLNHGRWRLVDTALGLPPGYLLTLTGTRNGDLWVPVLAPDQRAAGLAYRARGASGFRWLGGDFDFPRLAEDLKGNLWIADRRATQVLRRASGAPVPQVRYPMISDARLPDMAFDRWGGLWEATRSSGILRIAGAERPSTSPATQVERFSAKDGLSSDASQKVLADREGNVWVATAGGLDRFRYADVVPVPGIPADPKGGIRMTRTRDGSVFVTAAGGLYRIAPGAPPRLVLGHVAAEALCPTQDGSLLLIERSQILKIGKGRSRERFDAPSKSTLACAEDNRGRLWIVSGDRSTWWHDGNGWHMALRAESPALGLSIAANRDGIAFGAGRASIAVAKDDRITQFDLSRLGLGEINSVDTGASGFIVSSTRGLVRIRGRQLRVIDAKQYPFVRGVRTVVQTTRGETWLYGDDGISRLSTSALDRAFDKPGAPLAHRLFDFRNGLASRLQRVGFAGPQAVAGGDGRIWFATANGLFGMSAAQVNTIGVPASVAVRSLAAAGQLYRDPTTLVLPPGTTSVRFTFSAASLGMPDRLRFRYRLDGVDDDWVMSGARRATTYTSLGPGTYRFHVAAATEDGVWSSQGGAVDFEIRPTFTQGWPFRLLCGVAILALLWLAYRLRIRAVAAQLSARLAERHDERERIARELHDTLLQSVHALMLRVAHAASTLPADQPARKGLDDALDRAQEVIAQGLDQVRELRPPVTDDLSRALTGLVQAQAFDPPIATTFATNGTPRPLTPAAAEQILRIANEALFNIARHARADRVEIGLTYAVTSLVLRITDDGVGIDPAVLAAGTRTGHYGLIGMRERADQIGAELIFDNGASGGAEVTLLVPAATAYAKPGGNRTARVWPWLAGMFGRSRSE